jgi:Type IV secretion-system coupling protein DNA-binding domain.
MARSDSKKRFSGVSRQHRVKIDARRDDTRTFSQRMLEETATPGGTLKVFGFLACAALVLSWAPFIPEIIFLISLGVFFRYYRFGKKFWDMPFRVPSYLNTKIAGSKVLDASTQATAAGNLYLGMDEETNEEVWASTSDVNKHVLMIGTTGSGKTEAIMGHVFGLMARGSGTLIVDGKASVNTYDSTYKIARLFGREVDLFAMDYLTGGKDVIGPQQDRRSHTFNPLAFGGSAQKAEMIVSLLDSDGDMWSGRAISFIESIIPPLSYLSERGYVLLNPSLLGDFFLLENIENLVWFGVFVDLNGRIIDLKNNSKAEWEELQQRCNGIMLYLDNLPSYSLCRPTKPHKPQRLDEDMVEELMAKYGGGPAESDGDATARQKVSEQHGYITMQLVRAINNLSNNYGFIYGAEIGEISFEDLVLNRRSLVVLLPSLERSTSNLEQLGKLTVLALKSVLGSLLNTRPEGSRREIIEGNPSNSKIPFGAILDEVGYYIVKGVSVIPAQARSLGVAVYFGTQSIPDLMKADQGEGKAIIDNTALKLFGRLASDMESDTAKTAINAGGKAYVQVADSMHYERNLGVMGSSLKLEERSALQEQYQISYDDLTRQENGQFHLIVGAKDLDDKGFERGGQRVVRMLAFYTGNIDNVEDWRRNPFVIVKPPSVDEVVRIREAETASRALRRSLSAVMENPPEGLLMRLAEADTTFMAQFLKHRREAVERGEWPTSAEEREAAVKAWYKNHLAKVLIERDIEQNHRVHENWSRKLQALAANTAPSPVSSNMYLAAQSVANDWHQEIIGGLESQLTGASNRPKVSMEAVLVHQELARDAAEKVIAAE